MKCPSVPNSMLLFVLLCVVSACVWTGNTPETTPTLPSAPTASEVPPSPTAAPLLPATPTSQPEEPSPTTIAPGSFADFDHFAAEIAAAIQNKQASFFGEHASISISNCTGDETIGPCAGRSSGAVVQGIPVSREWATYTLYSKANYQALWQTLFTQKIALKLVALADRFGDNPLMPLADHSFMAVVAYPGHTTQTTPPQVRVLFFEYTDDAWVLRGELVTSKHAADWLKGGCSDCYDDWISWPN